MSQDIARDRGQGQTVSLENVLRGIERLPVHLHHVVKMRSGGESTAADQAHHITALDTLPYFHQGLGEVTVERFDTITVIEFDDFAELGIITDAGHTPLSGSLDGCIGRCADVETVVPCWLLRKR